MDFGQDYYELFGDYREERVPFYMTYPMSNPFLEEAEYERDCRRLQQLYQKDAGHIQELVERECDKMEYDGSMMFDEYPDRLLFRLLCRNIYRELKGEESENQLTGMDCTNPFMQLIEVMLAQEMFRRRCRRRRCCRRY